MYDSQKRKQKTKFFGLGGQKCLMKNLTMTKNEVEVKNES